VPNFTENSRKEFEKFTGPTAVISKCYVNANKETFEISEQRIFIIVINVLSQDWM